MELSLLLVVTLAALLLGLRFALWRRSREGQALGSGEESGARARGRSAADPWPRRIGYGLLMFGSVGTTLLLALAAIGDPRSLEVRRLWETFSPVPIEGAIVGTVLTVCGLGSLLLEFRAWRGERRGAP